MAAENLLVEFDDGTVMVFAPRSCVRIANRGPSLVRKKDFEQVRTYPPEWVGFGTFEARMLAAGHRVETHRGLKTVTRVERGAELQPGISPSVLRER